MQLHAAADGLRSIPACAGEPNEVDARKGNATVYPRVCGGTMCSCTPPPTGCGLSPRVRGNRMRSMPEREMLWSIPACAGEPAASSSVPTLAQVYPRVCGGTGSIQFGTDIGTGLSPRVRGNRFRLDSKHRWAGSIPACAGEPDMSDRPRCGARVYPRVCGGTGACISNLWETMGLSPRVRGNLHRPPHPLPTDRSIPACAGEPYWRRLDIEAQAVYPRVCGGTLLA